MEAVENAAAVDKSGDRIRRMFAGVARRYDFLNHLLSLNIDRYWRWYALRKAPPHGTDPILDVCTGTGDLALGYARAGRGLVRVVGADFCAPMLEVARRKSQRSGVAVEWIEADAQDLPFEDNVFQIVSVAFGLRNVSDTRKGLEEMIRVAKPGGRVAILEFSRPRIPGLKQLYLFYFRSVLPRIGQRISKSDDAAYNYLPASVMSFPDGREMLELLQECGLKDCRLFPLTFGICTLYLGVKA